MERALLTSPGQLSKVASGGSVGILRPYVRDGGGIREM